MGNFNPSLPTILGMELVALANSVRVLDIGTEIGYGFTVTGAPNNTIDLVDGMIAASASAIAGQTILYNIYPRGREDDIGEISIARYPVATASATGAVVSGSGVAAALQDPNDSSYVLFDAVGDRVRATMGSSVDLTGKRILAVDLRYQAAGTPGFTLEPTIESNTLIYSYGGQITGPPDLSQVSEFGTVRFGEVNPWWTTASTPATQSDRMPWRWADFRWASGPASGTTAPLFIGIRVSNLPVSGTVKLGWMAVDIYYCEESRVAYGGNAYGQDPTGVLAFDAPFISSSSINVRDTSFASPVTLTAGDYTITATLADAGDRFNAGDKLSMPEIFQYRGVQTHPLTQIAKFSRPVGIRPAQPPVAGSTDFLVSQVPALSGTALQFGEAPVPYATVEGAPVYLTTTGTSIFARQQIHNEANPADTSYEQVRFYARRFNPLAAGDLTVTVSGSGSATITGAQFNELDEILLGEAGAGTGWREVTLPITAVFLSDGTFRNVTFTMTGVATSTPTDQWQVLVLRTGRFQPPGAPSNGSTPATYTKSRYDGLQNGMATWHTPQTASGTATEDVATSTVVVMFSQDAAAPTGLAVAQATQSLRAFTLDCGSLPMCIPTGIGYNRVTWTAPLCGSSSPIVTGGYLELQRMDTVDSEWQTIATTSVCVTGISDYEARAGIRSSYRIRTCNASEFCGPWSSTVNGTLPAPGVTGAGDGNSVLIFTSNYGPTGNLAYVMNWDGNPEEDFNFPEGSSSQIRAQYQRDFYTAYHGTERGGETFSRMILVQATAIAAESLADFKSLRDLAWADLPYVCVRDELGNRWFAHVQVPNGVVKRNRRLYFANINVIEVTSTPAPVVA